MLAIASAVGADSVVQQGKHQPVRPEQPQRNRRPRGEVEEQESEERFTKVSSQIHEGLFDKPTSFSAPAPAAPKRAASSLSSPSPFSFSSSLPHWHSSYTSYLGNAIVLQSQRIRTQIYFLQNMTAAFYPQ